MVQQQQIDLDEKIAIATECLTPEYVKTLHSVSNEDDVLAITEYLARHKDRNKSFFKLHKKPYQDIVLLFKT
jgi:hypothetical protein